jgi:hypothetical protein
MNGVGILDYVYVFKLLLGLLSAGSVMVFGAAGVCVLFCLACCNVWVLALLVAFLTAMYLSCIYC